MRGRERFSTSAVSDLLNYPFRDPEWEARLLALTAAYSGLLLLTGPLAEALEMGFALQVARRVMAGEAPALPPRAPGRWRQYLRDGLRWLGISLAFNLPAVLALVGAGALLVELYGLPQQGAAATWPGLRMGWPVIAVGIGLAFVLSTLGGWLSNLAVMHALHSGSFWMAFQVGRWLRILWRHPGWYARAFLFSISLRFMLALGQFVVSLPTAVLVIVPGLVAAFLGIYHRLVMTALYAQLYRDSLLVEDSSKA